MSAMEACRVSAMEACMEVRGLAMERRQAAAEAERRAVDAGTGGGEALGGGRRRGGAPVGRRRAWAAATRSEDEEAEGAFRMGGRWRDVMRQCQGADAAVPGSGRQERECPRAVK